MDPLPPLSLLLPLSPSLFLPLTQELKGAWGGSFSGEDTWHKGGAWSGVAIDSNGNVVSLELAGSSVKGPFPAALRHLTRLQILDLQGNELQGQIPSGVFKEMKFLSEVYLSNNKLTGSFPWSDFAGAKSISMLELGGNKLKGTIPPSLFGKMKQLRSLVLGGGNNFSGPIPSKFASKFLYQVSTSGW